MPEDKAEEVRRFVGVEVSSPDAFDTFAFYRKKIIRLGLPQIGNRLKQNGYEVAIICENIRRKGKMTQHDWKTVQAADVVGLSTLTASEPRAYMLADEFRAMGKIVIIGGAHTTFAYEEAADHVDYVVLYEGDDTILELMEVIYEGRDPRTVKGIAFKDENGIVVKTPRRPPVDLATASFADLSLVQGFNWKIPLVDTSRGCPFKCNFCCVKKMFHKKFRTRPAEAVLDEIARIAEEKPSSMKHTMFCIDDNIGANIKHLERFAQEKVDRGFTNPWSGQFRWDFMFKTEIQDGKKVKVVDHERMRLLKASGLATAYIGFESIDPDVLRALGKGHSPKDYEEAIKVLHDYGIWVHGMFVIGFPTDKVGTGKKIAEFAKKNGIETFQITIFTPFIGTEAHDEVKDDIFDTDLSHYNGFYAVYHPKGMTAWELQIEQIRANLCFYSPGQIFKAIRQKKSLKEIGIKVYGLYKNLCLVPVTLRRVRELKKIAPAR